MRVITLVLLFATAAVAQLPDPLAGAVPAKTRAPPYEQGHKDVIAALASLVACIGHCLLFYWLAKHYESELLFCVGLLGTIGFIVFCAVFFGQMWQDYVKLRFWPKLTFTVVNSTSVYYPCAAVACDHGCSGAPTRTSCSDMKAALQAGPCDGGYRCCQDVTYTYSCGSSSAKRTCTGTHCVSSVDHLWCTVITGTCATLNSLVTFALDGTLYYTIYHQECGLDDTVCITRKQDEYVMGKVFRGWQNPEAPDDIHEDVHYEAKDLGGFGVAMAFIGIAYLALFWVVGSDSWMWLTQRYQAWREARAAAQHVPPQVVRLDDFPNAASAPPPYTAVMLVQPPAYKCESFA